MVTIKHKVPDLLRAVDRLDMILRSNATYTATEFETRLRFLIANTLNECKDIMDVSIDRVDNRLKNNIEYIESTMCELEASAGVILDDFGARIAFAALGIMKPATPLFLSIEPSCIIQASNVENVVFTVRGYFPHLGVSGFEPSLILNETRATLVKPSQKECSFSIPQRILFSMDPNACVANIEIPVKNSSPHKYKLLLGIIPPSPGTISVEHTDKVAKREINPTPRSGHFHFATSHNSWQKANKNELCRIQTTPGWKVLRGSHRVQVHHNKGATALQLETENDLEVAYRAQTLYRKSKRACGELRFTLSFSEYRELDPVTVKTAVELKWNESKLLNFPPDTWKVIFTPFDQPFSREFLSPSNKDPYININSEGPGLRISTKDPTKVKRLQVTAALPDNFTDEEEPESYLKKMLVPAVSHTAFFALGYGVGYGVCRRRMANL
jgi:hypothetical protein